MSDEEYFAQRARAERELSKTATDPRAAAIHAKLAARYEEVANPKPRRPTLCIHSGINWAG